MFGVGIGFIWGFIALTVVGLIAAAVETIIEIREEHKNERSGGDS